MGEPARSSSQIAHNMFAEPDEQPRTLAQRIAALKTAQANDIVGTTSTPRPRPPPPPIPTGRPPLPARTRTINNPPIASYGSCTGEHINNEPVNATEAPLLLAPPTNTHAQVANGQSSRTRPLPPPLPVRKPSAPLLPPRGPAQDISLRGGSTDSAISSSTVSSLVLSKTSSRTSLGSVETRKLPPPLEHATLPPLPPTKREIAAEKIAARAAVKVPFVTSKSAPLLQREFRALPPPTPPLPVRGQQLEREDATGSSSRRAVPSLPTRAASVPMVQLDGGVPGLPARNAHPALPSRSAVQQVEALGAATRKLPPQPAKRSLLQMGFNFKPKATSENVPDRVANPQASPPCDEVRASGVVELTDQEFEQMFRAGTPFLADFYTPRCRYCVDLDPIWDRLSMAFEDDQFVFAKIDVSRYSDFVQRFVISQVPTLIYFDGHGQMERVRCAHNFDALADFVQVKKQHDTQARSISSPVALSTPPPINLTSKPSRPALPTRQASLPSHDCLVCRDYSQPDHVASQYPRSSLPQTMESTAYLADVLCSPFVSLTDKARAIFTWLHHNVAYDTQSYFTKSVKHVSPADTVRTGAAVCGGYAGLFCAIALKAGLEAVVVTGHGKGYGFSAWQPGQAIPPCDPKGHAWNAVRLESGKWKLIDCCWGAGHVRNKEYEPKFTTSFFTMSNDEFGRRHFPADAMSFHRDDACPLTWEQYIIGDAGEEGVQVFNNVEDQGIARGSITPAAKRIRLDGSARTVRFEITKACAHWDFHRDGRKGPACMVLYRWGRQSDRNAGYMPFDTDGSRWWLDVPLNELGNSGDKVAIYAVTTVDGVDARGMSKDEYLAARGRRAMKFAGLAEWVLV